MSIKKDCYAYNPDKNKCKNLLDLVCQHKQCSFYMTSVQFKENEKKFLQIKHKKGFQLTRKELNKIENEPDL